MEAELRELQNEISSLESCLASMSTVESHSEELSPETTAVNLQLTLSEEFTSSEPYNISTLF
jgi:hypothetical protein